ncbi:hypothetical protein J8J14_20985 [Roseomonas sp. SSH11]|uniref:DUF6894 domain-containing protein n=1 Tax=Pararoseomonas baculiformis TaxID=2820812 RepID=A0ABS4AJQ3_9PROT|nr:hypothetical protein [Pararoseomonas baculiformis]MBP0447252.1 hypothetical protein [Pararoseomonas baculiformis]
MPRYFFNVWDGTSPPDIEGEELADDRAARLEAVRMAGDMLRDEPSKLIQEGGWILEVTDERGACRFALDFRAVEGITLAPVGAESYAVAAGVNLTRSPVGI